MTQQVFSYVDTLRDLPITKLLIIEAREIPKGTQMVYDPSAPKTKTTIDGLNRMWVMERKGELVAVARLAGSCCVGALYHASQLKEAPEI